MQMVFEVTNVKRLVIIRETLAKSQKIPGLF